MYLTGAEQDALAAARPANVLLQSRGNAGTHDLRLARGTLASLAAGAGGEAVRLPRYTKSLRGGRGDRAPMAEWPLAGSPPALVLLEGWMLGFVPVGKEAARRVHPGLEEVDAELVSERGIKGKGPSQSQSQSQGLQWALGFLARARSDDARHGESPTSTSPEGPVFA